MRPRDFSEGLRLRNTLVGYDRSTRALLGLKREASLMAFVEQVLESMRRVRFMMGLSNGKLAACRADPTSPYFDPVKAALLRNAQGDLDDACWLCFLSVHFGKHRRAGWQHVKDIYGCLNGKSPWSWKRVSVNPTGFREWLCRCQIALRRDGVTRFGNHRKYQSLDANSETGTGAAVETYIRWVRPPRDHAGLIKQVCQGHENNPRRMFLELYNSMQAVASFGRTARFDYLTLIGKIGLVHIEPGSTFMRGATGPRTGAKLLFGGDKNAPFTIAQLETLVEDLEEALSVGPYGMQIMEDALCNWQKSPNKFIPFRG